MLLFCFDEKKKNKVLSTTICSARRLHEKRRKRRIFGKMWWVVFFLKVLWFCFIILKKEFKWKVFQKRFLCKVYMFSIMIYNVKALFDDYDFQTLSCFFEMMLTFMCTYRVKATMGCTGYMMISSWLMRWKKRIKLSGLSIKDESVCSRMLLI